MVKQEHGVRKTAYLLPIHVSIKDARILGHCQCQTYLLSISLVTSSCPETGRNNNSLCQHMITDSPPVCQIRQSWRRLADCDETIEWIELQCTELPIHSKSWWY